MLTNILIFIAFIFIICIFLLKYTVFNYWKKRNVPYVTPHFIFGNIWELIALRRSFSSFIRHIQETHSDHGYVGIYNMFSPALIINDQTIIKDIMIKDFEYFQDNWYKGDRKIDPVIGVNPFVVKGKEWLDTRKLFTAQFTGAKLKLMCPSLQNICKNMVQYLNDQISARKSTCIGIVHLSARVIGDAVMCCGYGLEGNSFSYDIPDTFKIAKTSAESTGSIKATLRFTLGLYGFFNKICKVTFYGDPVPQIFYDIILKATEIRKQNNVVRNDLLNHLMELRSNQQINSTELVGHAFTFFLDGYQTSYAALSYAILELSQNPDIQEVSRREVETVLLKYNGEITFEAYKELRYLENVVLETLRKYPIIAVMAKVCTRPYEIHDPNKNTSFTIEKGTPIFWSNHVVHHQPNNYPEPEKFDPNRFTDEEKQARPKCSFLGFGDGPRICFGRPYALLQLVFALAAILPEFELQLNKKTTYPIEDQNFHLFDVPRTEMYVDFVPRNKRRLSK